MDEMIDLRLGDCLEILPTLESVDLVITDPPYGINYKSNRGAYDGNERKTDSSFGEDKYNPEWMLSIERVMKPDSFAFVFVRWDVAHLFKKDALSCGLICVQRLIWDKRHWGMGDLRYYGSQTEDALMFRKGAPLLHRDKRRGNIWEYASKAYFPEGVYDHPSQKPMGVIAEWINDATMAGSTILDPFMGSGTTGAAAVKLGRSFIGIEKEPKYFEIAQRRIQEARKQMVMPL
jgi:DNA modification methylase